MEISGGTSVLEGLPDVLRRGQRGAFHSPHRMAGGIAASAATATQLNVDVRFLVNAVTITVITQKAITATFA